ncbi:MAG TPA: hypothetical protein VH596_06515 [Terriglobales bacterium]|jgi:hypothetical protein
MQKRKAHRKKKGDAISRASNSKDNILPFNAGTVKDADQDSVARWLDLADQVLATEENKRKKA